MRAALAPLARPRFGGTVVGCTATVVEALGLSGRVGIGDLCRIERRRTGDGTTSAAADDGTVLAEVVGFDRERVRLSPYEEASGIALGARVAVDRDLPVLAPDRSWLGRVVDALGQPVDGRGRLPRGPRSYPVAGRAPAAHERGLLGPRLELGVRALDLFTPCRCGQRLGIFAGSGVGKSTLLAMIAARSRADALVIGLVGERGRELAEWLEHGLGEAGRRKSVVVVATSDQPAMMRKRAAQVAMTIAEALREEGLSVLLMLDSVTRFAMALREIHLAAGEPPTSKGYPPGVFAELARLLERAGPGRGPGSVTALVSVLVEGDDTNDPIADAVRGILDGHVLLDRRIAEAGRFPAVDVLKSVSRAALGAYTPEERALVGRARALLARWTEMAELVQLGAYRAGSDPELDEAIRVRPALEHLLAQAPDEPPTEESAFALLARALGRPWPPSA
ncbi:MAG: FliI/YscN family ATPase [Geminicoccaceae bacterium]|nr:FliI/YscN family ATPase [Geminicoccaceae bacterium]